MKSKNLENFLTKHPTKNLRDVMPELLKAVDYFRGDYDTATMLAVQLGFIAGFKKGYAFKLGEQGGHK